MKVNKKGYAPEKRVMCISNIKNIVKFFTHLLYQKVSKKANGGQMNGFTIYKEYADLISLLSKKEQSEVYLAICNYMFYDEEPILNVSQMKIFNNLRRPLDKSKKKAKNGSSGKSKQNQNEIKTKSKQNQNEIKTKTHQDVYVYVNDNVKDNRVIRGMGEEEKEEKDNKKSYAEFVKLTEVEYQKLVNAHGEDFAKECITVLDNYKGSVGKKYISDYRAILNWVIDTVKGKNKLKQNKKQEPEWFTSENKLEEPTELEKNEIEEILNEIEEDK